MVKENSESGGTFPFDDKNVNKRRTVYAEDDERNYESSDRFEESRNFNSNEQRQQEFLNDRSYSSGMENLDGMRSSQSMASKSMHDWEKRGDFYEERQSRLNEGMHGHHGGSHHGGYPRHYDLNSYGRGSGLSSHRDMRKHSSYNMESDMMHNGQSLSRLFPNNRSPLNFPGRTDIGGESPDFCRAEKAIIINFKSECPLTKQSKSKVIQKYVFAPKPHLDLQPTSSHIIPNNHLINSAHRPYYYG